MKKGDMFTHKGHNFVCLYEYETLDEFDNGQGCIIAEENGNLFAIRFIRRYELDQEEDKLVLVKEEFFKEEIVTLKQED